MWLLVVIVVMGMLDPSTAMALDQRSASICNVSLIITDTKIQMATCDANPKWGMNIISMLTGQSSEIFLAKVLNDRTDSDRNPVFNRTMAAWKTMSTTSSSSSSKNGMVIMLPKTPMLDLDYDPVACRYDYDDIVEPHTSEATIRQFPTKKLELTILLPALDPSRDNEALLASYSVRIEVEAGEQVYEFDSKKQPHESLEVYAGSTSEEGKVLFLWKVPKWKIGMQDAGRKRYAFLLTVYAPSKSTLALNTRHFSSLLRSNSGTTKCLMKPTAEPEAAMWWTKTTILLVTVIIVFVGLIIGLTIGLVYSCCQLQNKKKDMNAMLLGKEEPEPDTYGKGAVVAAHDDSAALAACDEELHKELGVAVQSSPDEQPTDIHQSVV